MGCICVLTSTAPTKSWSVAKTQLLGSSGWKCFSPDFNYGTVELSEEQKIEHILAVNLASRSLVKEQ